MSLGWKVKGAPQTIAATTANLYETIRDAQEGAVINVALGSPFAFNIGGLVKRDPGVFVRWHEDQVFYLTTGSLFCSNITFIGGRCSYDLVTFDPTNSINYGAFLGPNASKIRLAGMTFDQSRDAINLDRATDIELDALTIQFALNDCIKGSSPQRVRVNNVISTVICSSWTTGYFNDSTPPRYGVGSAGVIADGGKWLDTSHSDFIQFFENTVTSPNFGAEDVTITNVEYDMDGQGIVNAGSSADGDGDEIWRRVRIDNCICRSTFPYNMFIAGTDIEITDTLIGSSGLYDMLFGATNMVAATIDPQPAWIDGWRFRGKGCTEEGTGNIFAAGVFVVRSNFIGEDFYQANVDFQSPTMNGVSVTAPELPRISPVPAWVPTYVRPSNVLPAVVPLNIVKPEILWFGGPYDGNTETNPALGRWLTARRGIWRAGLRNGAVEYRWTRNGTAISGATNPNYQVQAADSGQAIRVEVRHQNATGWSDWVASDPVTAA